MESTLEKQPEPEEAKKPTPVPKPKKTPKEVADITPLVRSHILKSLNPSNLYDIKVAQLYESAQVWRCRVNIYVVQSSNSLLPQLSISQSFFVHYDAAEDKILSSSPPLS